MKRNFIGILSLVAMSLMLNASAQAQSGAKANVPFAFEVGTAKLPAGTYIIKRIGSATIEVRNGQTPAAALSTVRSEYPRETGAKLVFHHLGNKYFLAEVWGGSGTSGMMVPCSKQEQELKKELQLASGQSNVGEEVLIALN